MKAADIERAVALHFGYREHVIVPNTSWGLNMHECDLMVLTGSGYGIEVEIKISRSDIIADKKKPHHQQHKQDRIKRLYFAIPEALNKAEVCVHIPDHAGILVVTKEMGYSKEVHRCRVVREAPANPRARAWTDREKYELARLGTMRYWCRQAPEVQTQQDQTSATTIA